MKSFDTELKKHADKIRMKASERRELRERVLSYMEYHPLPKQSSVHQEMRDAVKSESFFVLGLHSRIVQFAAGALALIMVIVPFAAEKSVPGDALYLVKTGITESIQSSLANSPYEKIEFETKLMERRIAEARVLESEGKLTDDVKTKIAETVKEHSDAVRSELGELRTSDAEGAAIAQIAFNSSLEVQTAVLTDKSKSAEDVDPILNVVKEAQEGAEKEKGTNTPSYDGLMARIELETTRAYELFESVKETATAEEIVDIERRFSDINRVIEETQNARALDELKSAASLAQVLGQIKKLIFFMTDINIRDSVSLEELVPVVLSEEERFNLVKEELRLIDNMQADIEKIVEQIDEVPEKVVPGIEEVNTLILHAQTALDVADIEHAENSVRKARELASDLLAILRPNAQNIETEDTTASTTPAVEEVGENILQERASSTEDESAETAKETENAGNGQSNSQSRSGETPPGQQTR